MNISIKVWYYNDVLSEWILKMTNDILETKDEYKYFRVISNNSKYFYASANDYFAHNDLITNLNGESINFTNVNGEIVN